MKKQLNSLSAISPNSADKKSYTTPTLQKFGAVKHLTAGGSSGDPEQGNGGVNAKSKQRP